MRREKEVAMISDAATLLREAMRFDPDQVTKFIESGWWSSETYDQWFNDRAREIPERAAIIIGAQTITYQELHQRVQRLAGSLQSLGLGKGDVVAIHLPNIPEFVITYLAVCSLGGVVTTIHLPYGPLEVETLLRHSRARAVICPAQVRDLPTARNMLQLKEKVPSLKHVIVVGDPEEGALSLADLIEQGGSPTINQPPVGADPFILLYTSGTSASPKGVPLSYQNMLSNARLSAPEHGLEPNEVMLSAAPFTHLFGLYSLHLGMIVGATHLLLPAFAPQEMANVMEQGQASVLFAAPAHLTACLNSRALDGRDLSHMKLTITAGSYCPPELIRAYAEAVPHGRITQLLGMTEFQAGIYTRPEDPIEVVADTAGRPSPGSEVRIVSDEGDVVGPGVEGELQIRGCSVFPGYFDNEEANASAFAPGGWFRTGDLAVAKEGGNIKWTGRVKDLINRGGIKYNPSDIEAMLDGHPDIEQAAIVPVPDQALGERACCFAVPKPNSQLTLEGICRYLTAQGIAKFKLPERLEIIDQMPLTPTRKIIKSLLKVDP